MSFCMKWFGCNPDVPRVVWYGVAGVVVLVFVILIAISFVKVDEEKVAVLYSGITQAIIGVGKTGLNFVQPGVEGEFYSNRLVTTKITSPCVTIEGIQASMSAEAQFLFSTKDEDLIQMFREVGGQEEVVAVVQAIATNAILAVCGNTTSTELYVERARVEMEANNMIKMALTNDKLQVEGQNSPIKDLELPQQLTDQLRAKETAQEHVEVADREREPALIDARTQLQSANFTRMTQIADAEAEAQRILFKALQDEATVMTELRLLGEQLATSAKELGITAAQLLTDVLETQQRGQEQSRALQLCLADCRRAGSEFSCGICFLADSGMDSNLILDLSP